MSRITGVLVALATASAVMTTAGSTTTADTARVAAASSAGLPREIPSGVELDLADGDRFRVWTSDNLRTVWGMRYDAAAGTWGIRQVVLRKKNLYCGDVDARTANGAVALVAECDRERYSDEQALIASHALWSADTVTWSAYELEGEAYQEPGISPDGSRAVYLEPGGYVTVGPEGFTRHPLETPGQEYTATATITDDAQVSYLYGSGLAGPCRIVVLTRTGDAEPVRQELASDNACANTNFANVDALTALLGYFGDPGQVAVISRTDAVSPWAVTQVAPVDAPGLDVVEQGLDTDFFTAPGLPLVALGSRTGRQVHAQLYDPVAQAWGPAATVHTSPTQCRWGSNRTEQPLAVLAAVVRCGDRNMVLTTRDGLGWRVLRMGERPLGPSADGRYVAVPGPTSTYVVSPELGVVTLSGGVTGRCDVVVPDGPQGAVQLVARDGSRRWPTLLRRVSAAGTSRLGLFPAPTPGRCDEAALYSDRPVRFRMRSTRIDRGQNIRIARRSDGWTVWLNRW